MRSTTKNHTAIAVAPMRPATIPSLIELCSPFMQAPLVERTAQPTCSGAQNSLPQSCGHLDKPLLICQDWGTREACRHVGKHVTRNPMSQRSLLPTLVFACLCACSSGGAD